jgi:endonuclease III
VLTRNWVAGRPVDIRRTLQPLQRGSGDPMQKVRDGALWRATRTPDGLGTLALHAPAPGEVAARAWGPGAQWLLDRVPILLGERDDWSGFDPSGHPLLRQTARLHPGLRLPSTGLVMESLVPAVLEQRVTGMEARRAWRALLYRYGDPAPGPAPDGMRIMPDAATILRVPTWDWHRWGVDLNRQRAIRAAATVAGRLEEITALSLPEAVARLSVVPGIGPWTAAETVQRAMGHPDEVSVGDFHVPNQVVFALTGKPRADDAEMLRVLSPWAGHRQRVVRLIEVAGVGAPRFGPRYSPIDTRAM